MTEPFSRLLPSDPRTRFYRGRSMAGTFRPGDRLTLSPVLPGEIRPGDVVVFLCPTRSEEGDALVHRVVAAVPGGWVVRGDSNPMPDPAMLTAETLVGRVTLVERGGRKRRVAGGRAGLLRGRLLHARLRAWRLMRRVGGPAYRWLRDSGLARWLWRPAVTPVCFRTESGPLVKYMCRGRTVASFWPESGKWECRRPYDLVLAPPHGLPRRGALRGEGAARE